MNDEIKPRTTRVEVRNPSPPSESISDGLAVAAISEITKIINDHQYIMSIKLEIEHVDQPVEDYPDVFTAEIPNDPQNVTELLIQQAELTFREKSDLGNSTNAVRLNRLCSIVSKRLRDIMNSGKKVDTAMINAFITRAVDEGFNVMIYETSVEEFKKTINNMDI